MSPGSQDRAPDSYHWLESDFIGSPTLGTFHCNKINLVLIEIRQEYFAAQFVRSSVLTGRSGIVA